MSLFFRCLDLLAMAMSWIIERLSGFLLFEGRRLILLASPETEDDIELTNVGLYSPIAEMPF